MWPVHPPPSPPRYVRAGDDTDRLAMNNGAWISPIYAQLTADCPRPRDTCQPIRCSLKSQSDATKFQCNHCCPLGMGYNGKNMLVCDIVHK